MAKWNNLYDIIMCYGPFHASCFAQTTEAMIVQMGYPDSISILQVHPICPSFKENSLRPSKENSCLAAYMEILVSSDTSMKRLLHCKNI